MHMARDSSRETLTEASVRGKRGSLTFHTRGELECSFKLYIFEGVNLLNYKATQGRSRSPGPFPNPAPRWLSREEDGGPYPAGRSIGAAREEGLN